MSLFCTLLSPQKYLIYKAKKGRMIKGVLMKRVAFYVCPPSIPREYDKPFLYIAYIIGHIIILFYVTNYTLSPFLT